MYVERKPRTPRVRRGPENVTLVETTPQSVAFLSTYIKRPARGSTVDVDSPVTVS